MAKCVVCLTEIPADGKCLACYYHLALDKLNQEIFNATVELNRLQLKKEWLEEQQLSYQEQFAEEWDKEREAKELQETIEEYNSQDSDELPPINAKEGEIKKFGGKSYKYVRIEKIDGSNALVRVLDYDGYVQEFISTNIVQWVSLGDPRFYFIDHANY